MDPCYVFVPNFPPPTLSLHVDGKEYSNQSQITLKSGNLQIYRERLQNHLKSRTNRTPLRIPNNNTTNVLKLCEISKQLSHCYNLIETINQEIERLSQAASSISQHQWNERISILRCKTNDLFATHEKYNVPGVRCHVKSLVDRRSNKRGRIRKRKTETKTLKSCIMKNRELKHQQIDQWLKNNAEQIRENRRQMETKQRTKEILMEVKIRKNEAKTNLMVFDSLKTLYTIRNRDRPTNANTDAVFYQEIEQLTQMWLDAFKKYAAEESELSKYLPYSNHWTNWKDVIFGESTQADDLFKFTKNGNSLNQLIKIRRLWDAFIVSDDNPNGSNVPFGWIIPNENPTDQWKLYIKKLD